MTQSVSCWSHWFSYLTLSCEASFRLGLTKTQSSLCSWHSLCYCCDWESLVMDMSALMMTDVCFWMYMCDLVSHIDMRVKKCVRSMFKFHTLISVGEHCDTSFFNLCRQASYQFKCLRGGSDEWGTQSEREVVRKLTAESDGKAKC